jgi:hypothetical protein
LLGVLHHLVVGLVAPNFFRFLQLPVQLSEWLASSGFIIVVVVSGRHVRTK